MSLVRMSLGGYRCFARRQDIELAPVTVVLGRNNAGKSALVRAPVLLETGFRTDSPAPLDLDRIDEDMLDSFTDLAYGHRPYHGITIDLTLETRDAALRVAAKVQHVDEFTTEVVSELELWKGGERQARLVWELTGPREAATYTIETPDRTWTGVPVTFRGLLPSQVLRMPDKTRDVLLRGSDECVSAYPAVRYFGPFRERPKRRYRLPARMPAEVGSRGENVPQILIDDFVRGRSQLAQQINADLDQHLPGWNVGVVERGGLWSVVLTSRHDSGLSVNLADAGTGVAQALPIFVQRAVDVLYPPPSPVLEVIEQPELHLHPAAHADLADLYLLAAERTSTRFLIETHSETLLLRLRRRIAENLSPASVAVYFVENDDGVASARRITIDEDGNLDYWPAGVFSEDYAETQALARAQWDRQDARAG